MAFRASDGGVVWSDAYRSDATMAALLRTGRRIPTRAERAAELEQKIAARPNYGYAASLGVAQVGYNGAHRQHRGRAGVAEVSREVRRETWAACSGCPRASSPPDRPRRRPRARQALNSILLGAYFSHNLSPPNLNRPEVWLYAEGGGMFSGNEGNTFYVESGLDTHLKWRLSLQGGLMYVFPTKFSGYDLGGVGFRLRAGDELVKSMRQDFRSWRS